MKAFIASCIVLALIISFSVYISMSVTSVCDEIILLAKSLPEDCKSAQAVQGVSQIEKLWRENYEIFNLTVRRELVLAVEICISNLQSVLLSDENTDYLSHVRSLTVAIDNIASFERPGIGSVL